MAVAHSLLTIVGESQTNEHLGLTEEPGVREGGWEGRSEGGREGERGVDNYSHCFSLLLGNTPWLMMCEGRLLPGS